MAQTETQLSISTPELVSLEFSVAGLGSRALASFIDYFLQGAVLFIAFFLLVVLAGHSAPTARASDVWLAGLFVLLPFLLQWGYFTFFEAFWNGQTPGKRLLKLCVIEESGRSITLFESASRNLLRIVDMLPFFYAVGAISMAVTRRQQRLGDLVARTLVIHQVPVEEPMWQGTGGRTLTVAALAPATRSEMVPVASAVPLPAISRLTKDDLRVLESFLARRLDLPLDARASLAEKLAARMCLQMDVAREVSPEVSTETFLERLAAARRGIR